MNLDKCILCVHNIIIYYTTVVERRDLIIIIKLSSRLTKTNIGSDASIIGTYLRCSPYLYTCIIHK